MVAGFIASVKLAERDSFTGTPTAPDAGTKLVNIGDVVFSTGTVVITELVVVVVVDVVVVVALLQPDSIINAAETKRDSNIIKDFFIKIASLTICVSPILNL